MTDSPGNKYTAGQCHNCGGYPPGPWLKQWRIDHPRSQRTPCRMRMSCTYNGKWSPEQLRTAWDYGPGEVHRPPACPAPGVSITSNPDDSVTLVAFGGTLRVAVSHSGGWAPANDLAHRIAALLDGEAVLQAYTKRAREAERLLSFVTFRVRDLHDLCEKHIRE
jgi:hypothetical protein